MFEPTETSAYSPVSLHQVWDRVKVGTFLCVIHMSDVPCIVTLKYCCPLSAEVHFVLWSQHKQIFHQTQHTGCGFELPSRQHTVTALQSFQIYIKCDILIVLVIKIIVDDFILLLSTYELICKQTTNTSINRVLIILNPSEISIGKFCY